MTWSKPELQGHVVRVAELEARAVKHVTNTKSTKNPYDGHYTKLLYYFDQFGTHMTFLPFWEIPKNRKNLK